MSTTINTPKRRRLLLDGLSPDGWAVGAAALFIILVVAGIFPRVPW